MYPDNDETRRPWAHSRENTRNHEPSYHSTSYTSTKDIHAKELRPLKMYAFQEKQSSRKPTNAKFKAPVDDDLDEGTRLPKYSTSVNKHPRWKREEYRDKTIPVDSSPFQKTRTSGKL